MAKMRVRARAVDMLGRQQIAGIPTAIHELFKNAHDAYATQVEVDYFRADELLIVRDDGLGMSLHDFETRWLTLGTESKVGANEATVAPWTGPRKEAPRPIMGEKGIGRLAIAAIGPQVFVLTRAVREDGLKPLVAALINWRFFEIPGLDLASVEVPIVELGEGEKPDAAVLEGLAARVRQNLADLGADVPEAFRRQIEADLDLADFDAGQLEALLPEPRLATEGYGTHFYIRPTTPILNDDIDAGSEDAASPLEKMLLGFSNTMMPGRPEPVIRAEFRDHRPDGVVDELIGGGAFFTPAEFEAADHHIEGEFDAFGQFRGLVSVYKGTPREHTLQWPGSTGRPTDCGPFRIKFAYVQGRASESRLPPDEWAEISQKLNRIGGLYVYRDGIRILPYGNSDYDFLNIERRRTKSAQDWFFSYRRIFGAVELTHQANANLVEKAGREGFRANRAYRELSSVLENFFERLAIDFFRPTSQFGDDFNTIKEALTREAEVLAKRERSVRERRKKFSDQLAKFFGAIERGDPSRETDALVTRAAERVQALTGVEEPEVVAQGLLQIEVEAKGQLDDLRRLYSISRPRGVGLTKAQQSDWAAYQRNRAKLEAEVFEPTGRAIERIMSDVSDQGLAAVDRRRRLAAGLEARRSAVTSTNSRLRREVNRQVEQLSEAVDTALRDCIGRLSNDIEETFADLGRTDTSQMAEDGLYDLQRDWEARIDSSAAATQELLEGLRDQLENLASAVANNESLDETTAAIESRAESYRTQLDSYVELAQIGMALGIVQHEFASTVQGIRRSMKSLQPWANQAPELQSLYRDLRSGFDHLDSYLDLFTPMSRRLNRDVVELTGEQIRLYLREVFGDRLSRHAIDLTWTPAFDAMRISGFASTFLPAFVNVVDNAIFWITFDKTSERWISLDADDGAFLISNGGPGVEHRVAERIFDFGETTKPGGRGMGLFISREALRKEGYDLTLEVAGLGEHPTFRIAPIIESVVEGPSDD